MSRASRLLLPFACLLLMLSGRARADASEAAAEPAGYRETVDEAVQEFGTGHFEESRALFARAHALYANARTHRGLGLAAFELRDYSDAIQHLEAALRSTVKPLTEDLRGDTQRLLSRANNFVARVLVDAKPSSATIILDGLPVQLAKGQPLVLQIGDHTLELRATGYLSETRRLNIRGGEQPTLTIVLAQAETSKPAPLDAPRADGEPKRLYKNPWLWLGVGVVLAGTAAGVAYATTRDAERTPYGGTQDTVLQGP